MIAPLPATSTLNSYSCCPIFRSVVDSIYAFGRKLFLLALTSIAPTTYKLVGHIKGANPPLSACQEPSGKSRLLTERRSRDCKPRTSLTASLHSTYVSKTFIFLLSRSTTCPGSVTPDCRFSTLNCMEPHGSLMDEWTLLPTIRLTIVILLFKECWRVSVLKELGYLSRVPIDSFAASVTSGRWS